MLDFRERQGLVTVIHVVLQAFLERQPDASPEEIGRCLDEIGETVEDVLRGAARSSGADRDSAQLGRNEASWLHKSTMTQAFELNSESGPGAQFASAANAFGTQSEAPTSQLLAPVLAAATPTMGSERVDSPVAASRLTVGPLARPQGVTVSALKRSPSPPLVPGSLGNPNMTEGVSVEALSSSSSSSAPHQNIITQEDHRQVEMFLKTVLVDPSPPPPPLPTSLATHTSSSPPSNRFTTTTKLNGRFPNAVVREIHMHYGRSIATAPVRRRAMLSLALVCRQWFHISRTHAWSILDGLSMHEERHLASLLALSTSEVTLTADLSAVQTAEVDAALADAMPRVRVLRLRGVHVPSVAAASKRKVFWTFPAPVLERLAISWATSSPQQEPLAAPPLLFQGYAPCLVDVELEVPPGQEMVLPPHCAAFANVSTLRLRASALRGSPSARFFHDQFPNLRSLSLGTTKGVGNTFKSGNTWTGTRVLEYLELQEEDNRAETQNSIVIIQMFAQDPDAIDCIHVRRGSLSLVTFIWRRFAQNSSSSRLFVFGAHHVNNRCVVSITDVKGRCRIISEMHPSAISSTLAAKKGATLSPFTELVLWQATSTEYLAQVATQHLPRLHKLIIFVRSSAKYGVGASQDMLATRLPWQVPALRVLRFTSMDISGADLFPQPARNPSVSARAVAGFVRSLPVELDRLELERVGLVDGDLMSLTSLANEVVIL